MIEDFGSAHRLTPLLSPRSIACVGASVRADTPGNDTMRTLRRGGFRGEVYGVNPNYREVEGYPCVARLTDLPEIPDLAVLCVGNDRLEEALDEAVAVGARSAVIFASCTLADDRHPPLADRLAAKARAAGMPVCGGNCIGFYNELDHVWICGFPSPRSPRSGSIAFVAHSGSVFGALAHNDPRLRFALAVSPGQEFTATIADYIDFAVGRSEVNVIGLFIEAARDPAGFSRALVRAAERDVPVVALKVGRTEAAAAAVHTHSGAIAGSDAVYEALFDRYGVIRVETLDELAATLMLLSAGRRAGPGGLVSIHDSGGERELLIDLADRAKVPFAGISSTTTTSLAARLEPGLKPENPLDAWGTGRDFANRFSDCLADLMADENAAIGLFSTDLRDGSYLGEGFAAAALSAGKRTTKPIAYATNYTQVRHDKLALALSNAGVPVLDGTTNALAAVRGVLAYRDFRERLNVSDPVPAVQPRQDWANTFRNGPRSGALPEDDALSLLADFDIPVVRHRRVSSAVEAVEAARQIGFPVALKTAKPGVTHKSEHGGVALSLRDAAAVADAYGDIEKRLGPDALVTAMMSRGIELALGMVRDPDFGAIVTVGAGGVLIELLADRRVGLAPFGSATARRLFDATRIRQLLDGYRGSPNVDLGELSAIVARFSAMASILAPHIDQIDVNPLWCGSTIAALDALVILSSTSYEEPLRWI